MADRMNQGGVAERQRGWQESAGDAMGAVAGKAKDLVSGATTAAEKAWENTSEGAQQAASAVVQTTEDAWSGLRSCMASYPFATFFFGVGVGAMAVMAMRRR